MSVALRAGPVALLMALVFAGAAPAQVRLPQDFSQELVLQNRAATALAFTPGRELLVAAKPGRLLLLRPGERHARTVLDLRGRICREGERGLVGVAVDPGFGGNRFVYVMYTRRRYGCGSRAVSRVSRFLLESDGRVDGASERVLLDNIPAPTRYHVGGDLEFGKDGYLYVSVGDGLCHYATRRSSSPSGGCAERSGLSNSAAREGNVLLGKILRVNRYGRAPHANGGDRGCALTGRTAPGHRCREIFAKGLRNPFRMAFDPNAAGTRFFVNDVGEQDWEEVNLGRRGADYGWNLREGRCAAGGRSDCGRGPQGLTDPIFAYHQSTGRPGGRGSRGCEAITGGAFVPKGVWPARFAGDYVFADYVCGKIFRLERLGGRYRARAFVTGLGRSSAVDLAFGPGPRGTSLYYTTLANGGEVRRIDYTPGNRRPTAAGSAVPRFGPAPLEVGFDARASNDPDGDALTYTWDFGDGSTLETQDPLARHAYAFAGLYRATLRVRDARGATSDPHRIRVDAGNSPPQLTITGPRRYRFGQRLLLRGQAIDEQDGALDGADLVWHVVLHHERHTHPYLEPRRGPRLTFRAPRLFGSHDARTTHLRVHVRAADGSGLVGTAQRALRPILSRPNASGGQRDDLRGVAFPAPG